MTKNKAAKRRGKEIRQATGLPFVVSMYLGRKGAEAMYPEEGAGKTALAAAAALRYEPYCECCGPSGKEAVGPKGSISIYYV